MANPTLEQNKKTIQNFLTSTTEEQQQQKKQNTALQELLSSPDPSPVVIEAFVEKIYKIKELGPTQQQKEMTALRNHDNWNLVTEIENAIESDKNKHRSDFEPRLLKNEKSDVIERVQNLYETKKNLNILFDESKNTLDKKKIQTQLQKNPAMPQAFAEVLINKISKINTIKDPTEREKELLKFSDNAASLTNQHKGYMSVLVKDVSRKLTEDDNTKLLKSLIPEIQDYPLLVVQKNINEINQHFHDKPKERQNALNKVIEEFISKLAKELSPKILYLNAFKQEYQELAKEMARINNLPSEPERNQGFKKLEKEAAKKFIPLPARKDFNGFIEKYHDIADIDTSKPRKLNDIQQKAQQEIKTKHEEHQNKIKEHIPGYESQLKEHQEKVTEALQKVAERQDIKADTLLSSINNIIQLMLAKIDATLRLTSVKEEKTKKWVNKVRDERKKATTQRTL